MHNTQPWRWTADGDGLVRLYVDRGRQLVLEDPAGRNAVISCGAVLDHLVVAAQALGWDGEVVRFPKGPGNDLLAEVRLEQSQPSPTAVDDLEAIRTRQTDRRRYTSWPVPDEVLHALVAEARRRGAHARALDDEVVRFHLERLAERARVLRAADPIAQAELERWVDHSAEDGVPGDVLPSDTDPAVSPPSRFPAGSVHETRTVSSPGDGVIVLGGAFDDRAGWLRTGEALSRIWLRATRDGMSVVPLSLPVEVDAVRHELRKELLRYEFAPHLLVRVGWQAIGREPLPATPRRAVSEVLRTT
ncbi:NAD(P)H nitroreductase [Nocardioides panacisoli]|uniref:NAD(P)H nitroreductase n=2 Tax=Nocardioides panacisoli TaxID=627624 RepID=A0ABP7I7Y3_9ACTN